MLDILKTFRSILILGFIFYLIFLFAKILLIPIFIFIIAVKLSKMINIKFNHKDNSKKSQSKSNIIDGEFEELD